MPAAPLQRNGMKLMASEWNSFRHIQKTRTPHRCITCGRIIPTGSKSHNYVGEYEGDFQNWHLCDYCHEYVYPQIAGEEIDVYYALFTYLQCTYDTCPECGWNYGDPKIHRDKDNSCLYIVEYRCGHKQEVYIPFNVL